MTMPQYRQDEEGEVCESRVAPYDLRVDGPKRGLNRAGADAGDAATEAVT
jgi:hypothetical protein